MGLQSQNAKIANFRYTFSPEGYIPLSIFFYKIWNGEEVLGPHPREKFHRTVVALKMWAYSPQNC